MVSEMWRTALSCQADAKAKKRKKKRKGFMVSSVGNLDPVSWADTFYTNVSYFCS